MANGAVEQSKSIAYVQQKGWAFRTTDDQIILEVCPLCGKDNWHFYMRFRPKEKDGLWDCKVCGQTGNLYQLKEALGDRMNNAMSMKDAAESYRQPAALPDVEAAQRALMLEAENENVESPVLDYLIAERGFTSAVIEKFKLGLVQEYGKRWLLIPFYRGENLIYVKYRTVPPDQKEFRGLAGRECPLFNEDIIVPELDELMFVEGEADALACLSKGIEYVVGTPGANLKKASWIKKLDDCAPKVIYICYDNDQVGQTAAKEMAIRIGIDKARNIVLPKELNGKKVKDINEWFLAGGTIEEFNVLKAKAQPFNVEGVHSAGEILEEIRQDIAGGKQNGKYDSQWPELNVLMNLLDDGDLVGIMAEGKVGKTTMAMNWLQYLITRYEKAGLMFCQEMQPKRLVSKWIDFVTDTPSNEKTIKTVEDAMCIAADMKADYLFGYTSSTKFSEVADTIRQAVRRYGVKFVCFDNLQLLCRNVEHSAQETSIITKQFKNLAMELGIVILLIIQPNRVREGEIVAARNAHGSSAIEKDVDYMICLHRNREGKVKQDDFDAAGGYIQVAENFGPQLLVRVDLSRYSSGGSDTLWMDGAKSKVTSFPKDAKSALEALGKSTRRAEEAPKESEFVAA